MMFSFRIYLGIIALFFLSGAAHTLIFGVEADSFGMDRSAAADNNVRNVSGWLLAHALMLAVVAYKPAENLTLLYIVCASMMCSALGSLLSIMIHGGANSDQIFSMCFNFSAPLLLLWRHYALSEMETEFRAGAEAPRPST